MIDMGWSVIICDNDNGDDYDIYEDEDDDDDDDDVMCDGSGLVRYCLPQAVSMGTANTGPTPLTSS